MMLGDSSIINRGSHATFRVLHAEDQKALVMHKYSLLQEVSPRPPRFYLHKWGQPKWYFYTGSDSEWQRVWSTFHQNCRTKIINGKKSCCKTVTRQILSALDDHGMAMWIMDDGSYTYGHQTRNPECPMHVFRLSTEGYTFEENELILQWLKERYDVDATINQSKKILKDGTPVTYFFIRVGWRQFEKISKRVAPFIIPSMTYKIGLGPLRDNGQLDLTS